MGDTIEITNEIQLREYGDDGGYAFYIAGDFSLRDAVGAALADAIEVFAEWTAMSGRKCMGYVAGRDVFLYPLDAGYNHIWQGPRFSAHVGMMIELSPAGVVKRTTRDGTTYARYHESFLAEGATIPADHPATKQDLLRLNDYLEHCRVTGEAPDHQGYLAKQKMTPERLSELAEKERTRVHEAVAAYGYGSLITFDAIAAYEDSLDILMYGNFASRSEAESI